MNAQLAEALATMDENKRIIHLLQRENAFYFEIVQHLRVKNDADVATAEIRDQMHEWLTQFEHDHRGGGPVLPRTRARRNTR